MRKLLFIIVVFVATTVVAQQRVPAKPGPIEVEQPNGAKLTILLVGDEWKHWTMTEDGYLIAQNENGFYCYKIEKKGEQILSRRVAKNEEERTKCEKRYLAKKGIKH